MKILFNAVSVTSNDWCTMKALIDNLGAENELTAFCDSSVSDHRITDLKKDYSFADENSDLSSYDMYISCVSECPQIIQKHTRIISVAIITDALLRCASVNDVFQNSQTDVRFWKDYDYCYGWLDYAGMNDIQKVLNISKDQMVYVPSGLEEDQEETVEFERKCIEYKRYHMTARDAEPLVNMVRDYHNRLEKAPLVTVVTITYNLIKNDRKDTIVQCIESVSKQKYPAVEHIIIDGASTDGTLEHLKPFEERGMIKVYSEPDRGLYDAMNKGIKRANGKYTVFINSDDCLYDENSVTVSIEQLEKHQAVYSFGNAVALTSEGTVVSWIGDINMLPYAMNYCHQTMFVQTERLRELNGFDLSYKVSSDSDMMLRLYSNRDKYCIVRNNVALYRLGGLSSVSAMQSRKDHSRAFYNHIGKRIGLSMVECDAIWGQGFLSTSPLHEQLRLVQMLSKEFDTSVIFQRILETHLAANGREPWRRKIKSLVKRVCRIHTAVEMTKEAFIKKYYVMGKVVLRRIEMK